MLKGYDSDGIGIAAFASDGKTVATAGKGGTVHLWDPVTGRRLLSLPGPKQAITGLEFLSGGKGLLVGYVREVRTLGAR